MVVEKPVAFTQAWVAMMGEAVQLQGQLSAGLLGSLITHPLAGQGEHVAQFMTHLVEGPMRVVDKDSSCCTSWRPTRRWSRRRTRRG